MAPMEPWERVWIDAEAFSEDVHSYINCTDCHGGQAVAEKDAAHTGLKPEVADDPETTCGQCHVDVAPYAKESLHNTLRGYDTALYARSEPEHHPAIEEMQSNHCDSCHADCGDCHVSQPTSVGGGLVAGHVFNRTPSMSQNCTACHGSRIKDEYYGAHEGIPSDVHFKQRMACVDCHTGDEMHGMKMEDVNHRYDGAQEPDCQSCHKIEMGTGDEEESEEENGIIREHVIHDETLMSCQVCHSTTYINCIDCHVEQTEEGTAFFRVDEHFLGFYVGLNPNQTEERPYKYVPLRHVPIAPDSFSFYGDDLLPNYEERPTWVYTTPHNIQRETPQTERCQGCHGNDDIFLTRDKLSREERRANRDVIVDEAPSMFGLGN